MTKKVGDILGIGLLLISIFIISLSLKLEDWFKWFGLIGGIIVLIVEI